MAFPTDGSRKSAGSGPRRKLTNLAKNGYGVAANFSANSNMDAYLAPDTVYENLDVEIGSITDGGEEMAGPGANQSPMKSIRYNDWECSFKARAEIGMESGSGELTYHAPAYNEEYQPDIRPDHLLPTFEINPSGSVKTLYSPSLLIICQTQV